MSEYYAVVRSGDSLTHYGIRGMKWGIRKALDRGDNRATSGRQKPHSLGYNDAMDKLKRATTRGGIIGGLAYAAKHKNELRGSNESKPSRQSAPAKQSKKSVSTSSKNNNATYIKNVGKGAKKKQLNNKVIETDRIRNKAEEENNKSFLGRHGFGKKAKALREANTNAKQAFDNYYNSLNKKERYKLRNRYLY